MLSCNNELKDLIDLVGLLETETDEKKQILLLQRIGVKLVTEYDLIVNDEITISPIIVEAYYYHPKNFPDCNTHLNSLQKRFNVLYRHSTKEGLKSDGRIGGADICLALNNDVEQEYYLSFLIKNSLVNNIFRKQVELNSILNDAVSVDQVIKNVLHKKKRKLDKVCIFSERKGIKKPCYKSERLAISYPWDSINKELSLEDKGICRLKQWRIAISNIERGNDKSIADKENGSKISDIYWDLAKDDFNYSIRLIHE